jgi:hypothetical protein
MFCDFQHALSWYVASAEHVFEKGEHVIGAFRTAERNENESVVREGQSSVSIKSDHD